MTTLEKESISIGDIVKDYNNYLLAKEGSSHGIVVKLEESLDLHNQNYYIHWFLSEKQNEEVMKIRYFKVYELLKIS
jgi:hypothetical protein